MTSKYRSLSVRARIALTVVASVAGSLLMTGCGLGDSPTSTGTITAAAISGKINGGPNPIVGATVKIFATGGVDGSNTGYGGGAFLQEAKQVGASAGQDTGADGSFSFQGGYPCPAGQFAYIVSSGGNTGGNNFNSKAYLVAALGRCEDLFTAGVYTGGFIYINELSTVAAAYALNNFAAIGGGNGVFATVGIGAPSTNNAAVGCIANGGSCPTTSAAGLRHAFQNAANLVSPFSPTANATLPGNSSARVPQQLLNSIANVVVACINSDGTANACQVLFNATGTNYTDGNTFGALLNLAKNPTLLNNVTPAAFLAAATPQTSFYQPFLSAAPTDLSVAITYPKLSGKTTGVQGLTYPYSGTLDINDNYYIGNYDSAAQITSNAASFTSNGTLVSFTPDSAVNITATGASADSIGHVFLVGYTPTRPGASLSKFTVNNTTGAINPTPFTLYIGNDHPASAAVDRGNNLWYGTQSNPSIDELLVNDQGLGYTKGLLAPVTSVAIDPDQNIWVTTNAANSSNGVGAVQNTGTVSAPTYSVSSYVASPLTNLSASGISFVGSSSSYTGYVANSGTTPGITPVMPAVSGAEVTSLTPGTHVSAGSGPVALQTDGSSIVWAADGTDVIKYTPAGLPIALAPCTFATVTTNATCNSTPYAGIQSLSIDSTGTIWFLSSTSGTVSQVIGVATPVWPLLSLGLFSKP